MIILFFFFFFSSRRRHTRCLSDWSSDVCSSDLVVEKTITDIVPSLEAGDILIDGGNSYYVDDIRRAKELADRKSTRLNSSHLGISYAVFCLKKKKNKT